MNAKYLSALVLLSSALAARADTVTIGTGGSANVFPFTDSGYVGEYQQAYSASTFGGPVSISAITFVAAGSTGVVGNYVLSLSATSRSLDGLSTVYASNIGSNESLFASGPISGGFTFTGSPFLYDPAQGNLLLDVEVITPNPMTGGLLARCSSDTARVFNDGGSGAPTASTPSNCLGSSGLYTELTYTSAATPPSAVTPEPGSVVLLGTGLLGFGGTLRRKRNA